MRFLILNTDYPEFLRELYASHPTLHMQPYAEQTRVRYETLFGLADFYSSHLRTLGHEAWDIYVNNEFTQKAWAHEHGIRIDGERWELQLRRGIVPWLSRRSTWFSEILSKQIAHYRPDVLLNLAVDGIDGRLLKESKPHVRLLIGQHAAPLPKGEDFSCYELLLSSLPNFVEYFQKLGLRAKPFRLAFEPRVLNRLKTSATKTQVSFVGSLSSNHQSRRRLLEHVCIRPDVEVWGSGAESLPEDAWARRRHKGKAWALEMYQILHNSRISLNHHIDVAEHYANNMRLFEATGVGTLLLTDSKTNLAEMFEPGREVVAYHTLEECTELIDYYLEHETEREAIARAGQQRTLREHSYYHRMQELLDVVNSYV